MKAWIYGSSWTCCLALGDAYSLVHHAPFQSTPGPFSPLLLSCFFEHQHDLTSQTL